MARREHADSVVVITGASSGIGRAVAGAFARQGAKLVLAARNEAALHAVARECVAEGAAATRVVPTDVRNEAAVRQLAACAAGEHGRIDVWVNAAGVLVRGRLEDTPVEAFRGLLETNLYGCVHGARAALPQLRGGGVIVHLAGRDRSPDGGAARDSADAAVRALSRSLRHELAGSGVEVVTVLLGAVDTPLYQHAANFTGRAVRPRGPLAGAEEVARAVLRVVQRPRAEVTVGRLGRDDQDGGAGAENEARVPASDGNLGDPRPPFAVDGGWRAPPRPLALRAGRRLWKLALAGVGAAAVLAVARVASKWD